MPSIARLGFVIPLGGTTLFFRREALEKVQGWDAHNVTEDADLGFRLARFGYRTELIPTVTYEEATCRPWAWIRQRSRWLKGFMVTYFVHMRRPRQLMADLGPRKFWGFPDLLSHCDISVCVGADAVVVLAGLFGFFTPSELRYRRRVRLWPVGGFCPV